MSNHTSRHPITFKRLVYRIDGMESVPVRRELHYRAGAAGVLTLDVYLPRSSGEKPPLVILVTGYPDVGVPRPLGCAFREMEMWISLGQLLAASGIAAVAYDTSEPATDIDAVVQYVTRHAPALGLDPTRIGLWAVSGHVPAALATLARLDAAIKAGVLSTGFMLDGEDSIVSDASRRYGFVNASAGLSVADLPASVPLYIARAGGDENPGLNETIDRFAAAALARNLPVTIVNHARAGHAFELNDSSPASQFIISQMLAFMRFWLRA